MTNKRLEYQDYSDPDLIAGCLGGDELCQEILYKRYFSYAMSVSLRYTRNREDAMEIVNDSYMKVLDNLKDFESVKSFKAWYSRILVNTAIDSYRRKLKRNNELPIDNLADSPDEEPQIEAELSVDDILNIFNQLPDNYRLTFNLYEIEGYSHEEIGQMMGVSTSTSRSNLARAKKMVREIYIKDFKISTGRNEAV
jgi:RNA polymerase sigma-70 factor (ECF subfamily)